MNTVHRRFNAVLHKLTDREYLLAKVAYEAAPTIAGIKPSSLVTFCRHERTISETWRKCNSETSAVLGCHYCELRTTDKYTLVLFYNPDLLDKVVASADNQAFLRGLGYEDGITAEKLLPSLRQKLDNDEFPHELGLLLGIPRDDVIAFIENKGTGCLFCGYWKVYNNPAWARSMFQKYDAAKLGVMRSICELEQRPVATAS